MQRLVLRRSAIVTASLFWAVALPSFAQELANSVIERIERETKSALAASGAPSASIVIVLDGRIAFEQAYGNGRIEPKADAVPAMRYAIGSVSKQFTAAAVLLLAQDGKLSLEDKVSRWFPKLTRADEITLRQLLAMTSGYQDYWPQDYVYPAMTQPATVESITSRWAGIPLDFEPGTKWQYSNTNYVIAAAIVEDVSKMPFMDFLRTRIFAPLEMKSVKDFDHAPLGETDAAPCLRNALGPLRPAPKEGQGWLFGAAQLAMAAHDLALWDIALIDRTVLDATSTLEMQTDHLLRSGAATGYGLGVRVSMPGGRRRISHGGAVSGYTSINHIYPDDRAAIVVFTNIYPGAAGAPGQIADRIAKIIFDTGAAADAAAQKLARKIYDGLTGGTIDRTIFTDSANAYFTPEVLADYAASLKPLGPPVSFAPAGKSQRGGMTIRNFRIRTKTRSMELTVMTRPDGQIDQYIVSKEG